MEIKEYAGVDKRRGKKLFHKEKDIDLIRLWHKQHRLQQSKRNWNWVELPKPERSGYEKKFIIRQDVAKGFPNELKVYQDILNRCNDVVGCSDKNFMKKNAQTKKKEPIVLKLKYILPHEWRELPTDKHRSQFVFVIKEDLKGKKFHAYEVRDPWMFVEQIKPHYITHRLVIDPQLDSELALIENKIERNNLWPAFAKLMGWRGNFKDWKNERENVLIKSIMIANNQERQDYMNGE